MVAKYRKTLKLGKKIQKKIGDTQMFSAFGSLWIYYILLPDLTGQHFTVLP